MSSGLGPMLIFLGGLFVDIGFIGSEAFIADKWIECAERLVKDCDFACQLPTPLDIFQSEVNDSNAYASLFEDDPKSKESASQVVHLASEALKFLEKLQTEKAANREEQMNIYIAKLKNVHMDLNVAESRLRSSIDEGFAKRTQLVTSLKKVQSTNRRSLSQSVTTWTRDRLVRLNDAALRASIMPDHLHRELEKLESNLVNSLKKLQNALEPEPSGRGVRARADKLLNEGMPLLKGGWFTSSIIDSFKKYADEWDAASQAAHKIASLVNKDEIAPLFHVDPAIARHFVDNAARRSFLDLVPCLACERSAYTLSSYAGGSSTDAFVCLRLASKCLKEKTVCGCYRTSKGSNVLLEHRDLPEEFGDNRHVHTGCSHMIFTAPVAPVDIGSSSLSPDANIRDGLRNVSSQTPLRICMVTWNVGSEVDIAGTGSGWGGVEGAEFQRDFSRLLKEACVHAENDIVAFAFEEASDSNSRDIINEAVKSHFGQWKVFHVYANAVEGKSKADKGYNDLEYLHELGQYTKYVPGVNLVVISREELKPSVRMFGMIFKGGVVKDTLKKYITSSWIGDKGTAIAQVTLSHNGRKRIICFAGSHLDAGKESKRVDQTTKTEEALKTIGCPDGAWWGGDFNPRLFDDGPSQICCPWNRLELLMHLGAKGEVVDLARSIDPIGQGYSWRKDTAGTADVAPFVMADWQCQGKQCSAGWHEFPIGFAPTFHKLYHRKDRNYKEGTCHFTPRDVAKVGLHGPNGLLSIDEIQLLNKASLEVKPETDGKCPGSEHRVELCWNAEYNFDGCSKKGYCHHVHHKDHCPGYTDRILHAFGLTEKGVDFKKLSPDSEFPIVVGRRYEAIPSIATADHTPVFAQFTVTYGEQVGESRGASRSEEL